MPADRADHLAQAIYPARADHQAQTGVSLKAAGVSLKAAGVSLKAAGVSLKAAGVSLKVAEVSLKARVGNLQVSAEVTPKGPSRRRPMVTRCV